MFLLSGSLFLIAWNARDRAIQATALNPDAAPADATVAIILAAAATEGFINEFGELGRTTREGPHTAGIHPAFMEYGSIWKELESSNGSTRLKYLMASLVLTGKAFNKGANPYQDWSLLIRLRDSHMHLKAQNFTLDEFHSGVLRQPDPVAELQRRGLARNPPPKTLEAWLFLLQTGAVADWACRTALGIINAVLDMAPTDNAIYDALFPFRGCFQGKHLPWVES